MVADVIGTWVNTDGAVLKLDENGQFSAHSLPQAIFWRQDQPSPFDGNGTWKLQKEKSNWEVKLYFKKISSHPASREIPVLVSGSGDSTYLYLWKGEEGEGLYKLEKKPLAAQK